ncbi:MAG: hypothetical protein ACM3H8_07905, partial [Sphingobacteriales bacterium]
VILLSTATSFSQDFKTLTPVVVSTSSGQMNEKVWSAFQSDFKDAKNVTWYKNEKNYMIKFVLNEIAQQVLYNSKGQQIYHLSYVEESGMPADVVKLIKATYYSYTITLGIKIEQDGKNIWVINLEDANKLLFVRIENNETELVKELEKAN